MVFSPWVTFCSCPTLWKDDLRFIRLYLSSCLGAQSRLAGMSVVFILLFLCVRSGQILKAKKRFVGGNTEGTSFAFCFLRHVAFLLYLPWLWLLSELLVNRSIFAHQKKENDAFCWFYVQRKSHLVKSHLKLCSQIRFILVRLHHMFLKSSLGKQSREDFSSVRTV